MRRNIKTAGPIWDTISNNPAAILAGGHAIPLATVAGINTALGSPKSPLMRPMQRAGIERGFDHGARGVEGTLTPLFRLAGAGPSIALYDEAREMGRAMAALPEEQRAAFLRGRQRDLRSPALRKTPQARLLRQGIINELASLRGRPAPLPPNPVARAVSGPLVGHGGVLAVLDAIPGLGALLRSRREAKALDAENWASLQRAARGTSQVGAERRHSLKDSPAVRELLTERHPAYAKTTAPVKAPPVTSPGPTLPPRATMRSRLPARLRAGR